MEAYTDPLKALGEVLAAIEPTEGHEVIPTLSALGRVLSSDLVARMDSPEFSVSHMDGFAVLASDFAETKRAVKLKVVGESNPETRSRLRVRSGQALRVSTGARIPKGSDSVVRLEDANERRGWIEVGIDVERGAYVYQSGSDFRKGDLLLKQGRRLRAQDIGLLLTLGHYEVQVRKTPVVAVIATGSELREIGDLQPGKVLNTHGPMFVNMLKAVGCSPLDLGISPDDRKELAMRIEKALGLADVVITLGGTSVGRRDLVGEVVKQLGPEVFRHGLSMDRGRVAGIAVLRGRPLVMLPGPVQGAMNAFVILAVPLIDRLGGGTSPIAVRARLAKPWRARARFRNFTKVVYVRMIWEGGPKAVTVAGETESITVLTEASGYMVVPGRTTRLRRGAYVDVNLLPGLSYPA